MNLTQLLIIAGAWCIGIYGAGEGVKAGAKAADLDERWPSWRRLLPLVPIAAGVVSGYWLGPETVAQMGVEIPGGIGCFFGLGAGASAAWVYGFVKNTLQGKYGEGE